MQEFRHLRRPVATLSPIKQPGPKSSSTTFLEISPFDPTYEGEDGDDDVFADSNALESGNVDLNHFDSSSDEEEELKEDFVDEDKDLTNRKGYV